ncbi:SusC/RagA family TonB-linked outer membrane protein [Persicitalea jodogahamensis]|uniref:SusC/RagA family TonB-linked outer membrane protein n=1 Tax=Persicitalea jodogahamensis TaxID=402147 RepID=A0A8J3D4L2_9BACT|nr:TonB-dependent receptor [Persicitalea jodogahamensis]GHB72987.1 SusC/RagA family TonB-linked outer membrane protein [Persicitalea jodogahamensis]
MNRNITLLLSGFWLLTTQIVCGQTLAHSMLLSYQSPPQLQAETADKGAPAQSLKKILSELEAHYRINILADARLLDGKTGTFRPVKKVEDALKAVLKPYGLLFEKIDRSTYVVVSKGESTGQSDTGILNDVHQESAASSSANIAIKTSGGVSLLANRRPVQVVDRTVTGRVTDEKGESLPGVNVIIKGTSRGTTTNTEGAYSLEIPDVNGEAQVLVFSFVGFVSQEVTVGNRNTVDVVLGEDLKSLEEVVVVGYNTTTRKNILGSVGSVKADQIEQTTPVNAFDAVQGRLAGVQISSNGGPGAGAEIRIRGTSTFSGGVNPLYIVDGQQLDDINNLNPADIASIEVLKDGASAAIYGSKSANGVVIITTKSGKPGELKLDVDYTRVYGTLASSIPTANTRQRFFYENVRGGNAPDQRNADSLSLVYQNSHDLQDLLTQTGIRDQVNVSLSGGSPKTRFYWNNGYMNEGGVVLNSKYTRLNSRYKLNIELNKRVNAGTTLNLSYELTKGLNENTVFQQIAERIPYFPIFEPNGTYTPEIAGRQNPIAEALFTRRDERNFRAQAFNFIELEILPSLTFKTTLGVNFRLRKDNDFDPSIVQTVGRPATGSEFQALSYDILQENYFNFRKKLGNHTISALAGMSTQRWNDEISNLRAISFLSDNIETFNNVAELNLGQTNTDKYRHSLLGVFGDLSYDYKGKYLLKGTLRRDGSSRFGADKRYGLFPSFSAGWRISDEAFLKSGSLIDNLLLRASYATTGNERIGNYESLLLYRPGFYYDGTNGVATFQLSNPDLGWESTVSSNLGLDLSLFKTRLNFNVDFWKKVTRDLLYDVPLPEESGFTEARQNIGSVENKGVDLNLGGIVLRKGSFEWYSSFNVSFIQNKVLELADEDGFQSGNFFIKEGESLGNIYGYKNLGIFPTTEHNAFADDGTQLTPVFDDAGKLNGYTLGGSAYTGSINQLKVGSTTLGGGDIYWQDLDNNFVINGFDRQVIGNGLPKIFGGFSNEFKYKSFTLSALIDYQFGNDIFRNYDQQRNDLNSANETPGPERIEGAWLQSGDIAEYASLDRNRTQNRLGPNSQYVSKGEYIRWRNVRLNYRLPVRFAKKTGFIDNASVFFSVNNIVTFTNYPGFNPELGSRGNALQIGQDNLRYPNKRDFIVGIKIGL